MKDYNWSAQHKGSQKSLSPHLQFFVVQLHAFNQSQLIGFIVLTVKGKHFKVKQPENYISATTE